MLVGATFHGWVIGGNPEKLACRRWVFSIQKLIYNLELTALTTGEKN